MIPNRRQQEDRRFGVSLSWLTKAKRDWEVFDWKRIEAHINSFPNFIIPVTVGKDTLNIHFIAMFSANPDAVPVVLLHGWPGNFLEFLPMLSLMKKKYTPETLPYHLVVPSLPGFAFSSKPPLDNDFGLKDMATFMNQFMLDLGFISYVAQGGDIGSRVAKTLGSTADACKAVHINFAPFAAPPAGFSMKSLTAEEKKRFARTEDFLQKGSAYALEHATRPSTIGLALDSSPLALLSWIGEKFLSWSDQDPSLETILESVTLYWLAQSMGSGIFTYRGRFSDDNWLAIERVKKPMGYSNFPFEIMPSPKAWVETDGDLVFYREHEKGGHFAALEQPEVLMGDVEDFIKQVLT